MRILHVGASGTIGGAVRTALSDRGHDVVAAHRGSVGWPVDISDPERIHDLLDEVGELDAVVCTAGSTPFGPWQQLDRAAWTSGIESKLLGQIELVRQAVDQTRTGGSFTLISGIIGRERIRSGSVAAAVNGALESWVAAAAAEMGGEHRLNAVSPTVLTESLDRYGDFFPGFPSVAAADVAQAFVRSVEGIDTGRIYRV
ncbi:short chain dehydrogenase [Nocardiopsis sp. NPDC050513]|uniref:short chain dehydrogenase n=1 Tax=Nocardiopsis sp. NPDC050513 TaxID=3364338 RepID=UPI0037A6A194